MHLKGSSKSQSRDSAQHTVRPPVERAVVPGKVGDDTQTIGHLAGHHVVWVQQRRDSQLPLCNLECLRPREGKQSYVWTLNYIDYIDLHQYRWAQSSHVSVMLNKKWQWKKRQRRVWACVITGQKPLTSLLLSYALSLERELKSLEQGEERRETDSLFETRHKEVCIKRLLIGERWWTGKI